MTEPTTAEARVALADRVHFIGRHDDVDPSPGPASCADTDCMTLRRLIDELDAYRSGAEAWEYTSNCHEAKAEALTTELEQANFDRSRLQQWFDTAKAELEQATTGGTT